MINWHSFACRRPDVMFLDDIGAPSCLNCGEIGAIDEDLSANAPNNPPETPQRASFELCWPASLSVTEDGSGHDGSTEQSKPTCPAVGEMFVAGETLRATDVAKHTTASAEMSLYEPLHARKIRILQLLPGEYSDPIRCNIRTVDLQFKPEYEALSYTWADSTGDASLSQRIYIGERYDILRITSNCANALRRLRFSAWSRDLWVDAICIDQQNIYERSHQVGIMRYIYATAKRVLVYLGEDAEDNGQDPAIPWKYENQGNTLELNTDISHRPYFTRTWIIQEIASARSAWIICGSRGMRWQDFVAAGALDGKLLSHNQLHQTHPWLVQFSQPKIRNLDELYLALLTTSRCQVSDPRDKVFALLGLFMGCAQAGLVADYSLNEAQVFTGLTAFMLQENSIPWCCIFAMVTTAASRDMPSWAIDWALGSEIHHLDKVTISPSVYYTGGKRKLDRSASGYTIIPDCSTSTRLRLRRNGTLVMKGFSPFCLSDCSLSDTATIGPPGVVDGIHYAPFAPLNKREAGIAKAKWAHKTDKVFVITGLPHHLMILRPSKSPTTYSFVGICTTPNVDFSTHLLNWLSKEAILIISAWNKMLNTDHPYVRDYWLRHWMWDLVKKTCQHIKIAHEDFVTAKSAGLSEDNFVKARTKRPQSPGTRKMGTVSEDAFYSLSGLIEIARAAWKRKEWEHRLGRQPGGGTSVEHGSSKKSRNAKCLGDLIKIEFVYDTEKTVFDPSSRENSTFLVQACWVWDTTSTSLLERRTPWSMDHSRKPSIRGFLRTLGPMLGGEACCYQMVGTLTSQRFLELLLRQDLQHLVRGYDNVLHNYRPAIDAEDQPDSEVTQSGHEEVLSFLRGLMNIDSDALSGDRNSAPWALDFLNMCSLVEMHGIWRWEFLAKQKEGSRIGAQQFHSSMLGLSGEQEPSDLTLEMMWTLLNDLVRGTEKWLMPLEQLFTSAADRTQSLPTEFWEFPPFVARAQWEDIHIA